MSGFSGFTEDEIRRFKMQGEGMDYPESSRQDPVKKVALNSGGKRARPREKVRTRSSSSKTGGGKVSNEKADSEKEDAKQQVETVETKREEVVVEEKKVEDKPREVEVVMEPEKVKELELSNLEKIQQKQREMELINKRKEKMLQTALKQRYAKTKKETETLKLVQKELSHLDNLLYTDVQILRDKIDHACREYDAARKRYDRAETEFINSKMSLHDKTETKDQLTEHLCSIIQQNEERKARKLAELMARLEMGDQEPDLNTTENICNDLKQPSLCPESDSMNTEQKTLNDKIPSDACEKPTIISENNKEQDIQNNNEGNNSQNELVNASEPKLVNDGVGSSEN